LYANGLVVSASGVAIKGLIINRFNSGHGIDLNGGGAAVQGSYIGTDSNSGSSVVANEEGIVVASDNNLIGGSFSFARNVISHNLLDGVVIGSGFSGNLIQGNHIGTDATGTAGVGNGTYGVFLGGPSNTVGGTASGAGNLISDNGHPGNSGVIVYGSGAFGNVIQGNYVGTNAAGSAALGNGYDGITVYAPSTTVGGTAPGAGNLLSGNGNHGADILPSGFTGNVIQG